MKRLMSPGVLAFLMCSLFVCGVLATHDWDPLAFAISGAQFTMGDPEGNIGYDGQFAYYIARDQLDALPYLDVPAWRFQRMLYPTLAFLISLGQPSLVPWALVAINVVVISISTHLLSRLLARHGSSPYLALLLPLWMGQVFALRADLNEPLALMLGSLALWWFERDRPMLAATALAFGGLAKEVALLFVPAMVLVLALDKRWRLALRFGLVAVLPYVMIQVVLYCWIGSTGLDHLTSRYELAPLYGYLFTQPLLARVYLICFIALPAAVLTGMAVYRLRQDRRSLYGWMLLVHGVFIVFLPRKTTADVLAVFRLTTGLVIAAQLFCATYRLRRAEATVLGLGLPHVLLAFLIPGFML